jgi:uncharacterized protein (TIGR03437 family)
MKVTHIAAFLFLASAASPQGIITTIAGTDKTFTATGVSGLNYNTAPFGMLSASPSGDVYFVDNSVNRVLKLSGGVLTAVAGNGIRGYSGDGGPALKASLANTYSVAIDTKGNLYLADTANERIRMVNTAGVITTIAGTGVRGISADGAAAIASALADPLGVAVDASGTVYFSENASARVRKFIPGGVITTVAGTGSQGNPVDNVPAISSPLYAPLGIALDMLGNLYIADGLLNVVRKVSASGVITTFAGTGLAAAGGDGGPASRASISYPYGLYADSIGNVFIAEYGSNRIRKVSLNGTITTVAGGSSGFSGDLGPATQAALNFPSGVAGDTTGAIYIADANNGRIRKVDTLGVITTIAGSNSATLIGDGGPARSAFFYAPNTGAIDAAGNIYIADTGNSRIRKIDPTGAITTIAGNGNSGYSGEGSARSATLFFPFALAVDRLSNVYFTDTVNQRIRRVTPGGVIASIAGNGAIGYAGDGGQATQASFVDPQGIAVDALGNVFISDSGNNLIRKIGLDGIIQTVAGNGNPAYSGDGGFGKLASLYNPLGITVDVMGNLYIADNQNHRVRKLTPGGMIVTIAGNGFAASSGDGGLAIGASLNFPNGVAVDSFGSVYISETSRIRKVDAAGFITTVAGNGDSTFYGDGGPATAAAMLPGGLFLGQDGSLYIIDTFNNRLRKVLATPPAFTAGPSTLTFTGVRGSTPPPSQDITITSGVPGLAFTATATSPWIHLSANAGVAPATLQISVDAAAVPAGQSSGTVSIQVPGARPSAALISVASNFTAPNAPQLGLDAPTISFDLFRTSSPGHGRLGIQNLGGGTLNFTLVATTNNGAGWLSVTADSSSATPIQPASLTVSADPAGLDVGTYTGSIVVQDAATSLTQTALVILTVNDAKPKLLVNQTGLAFTTLTSGGAPLPRSFRISNGGTGPMAWTAQATTLGNASNWLKISAAAGTVATPQVDISTVDVTVDPSGLPPSDYFGQIQIGVPGTDQSALLAVLFRVLPAGNVIQPDMLPAALAFAGNGPEALGSEDVLIANRTSAPINFVSASGTSDGQNWLRYTPASGTVLPGVYARITVQPDLSKLGGTSASGFINFAFSDGSLQRIQIFAGTGGATLSEPRKGARLARCTNDGIAVTPVNNQNSFSGRFGDPLDLAFLVTACGSKVVGSAGSVRVGFDNGDTGLDLRDEGAAGWRTNWTPKKGAAGRYNIFVTVGTSSQGVSILNQFRFPVDLQSGGRAPFVFSGGIKNAASGVNNTPIAPGTLISIYGQLLSDSGAVDAGQLPLPRALNGARILLGNKELPIRFSSQGQLNLQVPYDLPADQPVQLTVYHGDAIMTPEPFTVAKAQPGIFAADASGVGQGSIVDGNGMLVAPGNPATAGDQVTIFATGLGQVTPAVPEGSPAPDPPPATVLTPLVTIGGVTATVVSSTLTPAEVGRYQVSVRIPDGVAPGDQVPVVITMAGQSSPPVTISVQ